MSWAWFGKGWGQETISIETKMSFPIGITINELINNAYKYAFKKDNKGEIQVLVKNITNKIIIIVHDNGNGIEDKFINQTPSTFGFQLIAALAAQYNGSFKIANQGGTKVEVELKGIKNSEEKIT